MKPRILALDVDGTLTDGKIYIGRDGECMKAFDVKDGYALSAMLPRAKNDWTAYNEAHPGAPLSGVVPVVITGRESGIVRARCEELGIGFLYQGCRDKAAQLQNIAGELGLSCEEIAYMGDDLNDREAMELAGVRGCPGDAAGQVKECSDYICARNGGNGAVREFVEWMLSTKF